LKTVTVAARSGFHGNYIYITLRSFGSSATCRKC